MTIQQEQNQLRVAQRNIDAENAAIWQQYRSQVAAPCVNNAFASLGTFKVITRVQRRRAARQIARSSR